MNDRTELLCDRARNGDLGAASELVTLYYQRIYAYFRRLCGNDPDAEDLTQKTFFKVWVSLRSFGSRSSFSTWIHGIAHHVYCDCRRKRNPAEGASEEWWNLCAAEGPNPFDATADKEMAQRIYEAVERLEDGTRETVHLHYYQGLTLNETAEVLGVAVSTVKYRLRQALDVLRTGTSEPKLRTS
jgi:RNA polymerase sigma-70 factor (ECF subfamily)